MVWSFSALFLCLPFQLHKSQSLCSGCASSFPCADNLVNFIPKGIVPVELAGPSPVAWIAFCFVMKLGVFLSLQLETLENREQEVHVLLS